MHVPSRDKKIVHTCHLISIPISFKIIKGSDWQMLFKKRHIMFFLEIRRTLLVIKFTDPTQSIVIYMYISITVCYKSITEFGLSYALAKKKDRYMTDV